MIDNELETEENSLYTEVKESARKSFEEYYYAFFFLSVFVVGAFALYISTGVSRGIFIIIDLFLVYKMLKSLLDLYKNKRRDHLALRYQFKFLNRIYLYSSIILCEAITRHYLELNITIIDYLGIMAVVYGFGYLSYNVLKYFMKKWYLKTLETGSYQKIVAWKSLKHKLFVILSFFMVMMLVVPNIMDILKGEIYLVLMTVIYVVLLVANLEIKCDLEIEEKLLFEEGYFDFKDIYHSSNINDEIKDEIELEISADEEVEEDLDKFVADIKAEEEKLKNDTAKSKKLNITEECEEFFLENDVREKPIDKE